MRGDTTHLLFEIPEDKLRAMGPQLFAGVDLHYDPMPVLRRLGVPQLWILGADDRDAPSGETSRRLTQLARAGRPITLAVFPRAEHGIYEYEIEPDGSWNETRQPDGYFDMMRDFIRDGRLKPSYGAALITGRM